MKTNRIRILLVEDDELFRLGLRVGLQQEPDLEVVAEIIDGETAVKIAKRLVLDAGLDIVLLDVGLPGIGGLEACRQIKQQNPQLPVLILTSRFQKTLIAKLIEAGAQGYCVKGIEAKTLILAIRSVTAGASWWDTLVTDQIRAVFQTQSDPPSADHALTKRELEVLTLLTQGKTNHDIAAALYIAPGTVRVHVHTIMQKLEVSNRYDAVSIAIQKKLIDVINIPSDL